MTIPYLGEILSLGCALFWALAVILFKKTGESMPPLALNLFKNALAVVLLLPTVGLWGASYLPDSPLRDYLALILSGIIGIAIADTLFFFAMERLGAGLTAVIDAIYSPLVIVFSYLYLGEQIGPRVIIGATLVVSAIVIGSVERAGPALSRRDLVVGGFAGMLGVALMAIGIVIAKPALDGNDPIWATTVRVIAGLLALLPIIALNPRRRRILASLRPGRSWRIAVPAAFLGTYIAIVLWTAGMKYTQASIAAILNQLSIVFIFLLAAWFLKEPMTWRRGTAIALSFVGATIAALPIEIAQKMFG